MKKGIFKRVLSTALAGFLALTSTPSIAKEMKSDAASVGQTFTLNGAGQATGTCDGYSYEIWAADTPNTSSMTLGSAGAFSTTWKCGPNNSRGNFLARRGLSFGRNNSKHWQDYGNFTCEFDCQWSAGSAGNSRICIYGWTENPLVEYYIIEDWKNWVPSSGNAKQVTIDGSVYDVFTNAMNSYNITGSNGPFTQYISVRKTPRTSGTISIYKHFEAWENLGMKMGGLYEVAFNVEGWESDGQANVKKNVISYDGSTPVPGGDDPIQIVEPSDGVYFKETFESGAGKFEGRGDASVTTDSENYYSGSKSLYVTGRTDNWHGAAINLDPTQFAPGHTYSLSTAVLQKSGSATDIKFTLQQGNGDSATYNEVATVTAKSGEWTKVENTEFTIPSGSTDLVLYVEAPDSLTNFYIDEVLAAVKGTKSSVVTGGGTVKGGSTPNTPVVIPSETGLKNVFSKYFRIGTAVTDGELDRKGDFVRKHFNSMTPENQLKPQWILDEYASKSKGNNVNPQVQLPTDTKAILDFAVKYNIPMRGHTLVWHSQTPAWFFKQNFDNNGSYVNTSIMDQRMENFIKNTFAMLKNNYPTLNLYAYDVVNEAFGEDGNMRQAGEGNEQSKWTLIYGNDSFIEKAFTYAKQYAPSGCKLFYNDYNEYIGAKRDGIYNLCKKLYSKGLLDGVGMQSHLDTSYPSASLYKEALDKYSSIGCEIHVTELDVTCSDESTQANYYKSIVDAIKKCDAVTSLTFWGTNDGMSWRGSQNPLIFDRSYNEKKAYSAIVGLVPSSDWGEGYNPEGSKIDPVTQPTTQPTTAEKSIDDLVTMWGDANCDNKVAINDAVMVMQVISSPDKFDVGGSNQNAIKQQGAYNADVYEAGGGLTAMDALTIQQYLLGVVNLPVSYAKKK